MLSLHETSLPIYTASAPGCLQDVSSASSIPLVHRSSSASFDIIPSLSLIALTPCRRREKFQSSATRFEDSRFQNTKQSSRRRRFLRMRHCRTEKRKIREEQRPKHEPAFAFKQAGGEQSKHAPARSCDADMHQQMASHPPIKLHTGARFWLHSYQYTNSHLFRRRISGLDSGAAHARFLTRARRLLPQRLSGSAYLFFLFFFWAPSPSLAASSASSC